MIGSLRGELIARTDSEATVEVAGIGYRVAMTPRDLVALGPTGDGCFVWVHHQQREDAQTLYGFRSADDRDVFELLIGTHGVGPALGLAILSVHTPTALRLALATDDLAALCAVPGVGKKTAARLLMELKSRLAAGDVDLSAVTGTAATESLAAASPRSDVRDALDGLGYSAAEITVALGALPVEGDPGELLRLALRELART
jgi:Holliday junction DNA helicase RuvA